MNGLVSVLVSCFCCLFSVFVPCVSLVSALDGCVVGMGNGIASGNCNGQWPTGTEFGF